MKRSELKKMLPSNVVARLGYDPGREARTDEEKRAMDIDILYQSIRIARNDHDRDSKIMPLDPREKQFEFSVKGMRAHPDDPNWKVTVDSLYDACVEIRRQRAIHLPPPKSPMIADTATPVNEQWKTAEFSKQDLLPPSQTPNIVPAETGAPSSSGDSRIAADPLDETHSPTGESTSSGKPSQENIPASSETDDTDTTQNPLDELFS